MEIVNDIINFVKVLKFNDIVLFVAIVIIMILFMILIYYIKLDIQFKKKISNINEANVFDLSEK